MAGGNEGFNPDWCCPPGSTIKDWLIDNDLTNKYLAIFLGSDESAEELISGDLEIDEFIADELAFFIGSTKEFWLKREQLYRKGLAEGKKKCC